MTSAQLLNQREAAEKLGLSPKTLEKWRSLGTPRLPFVRLGSAIKYRESDRRHAGRDRTYRIIAQGKSF